MRKRLEAQGTLELLGQQCVDTCDQKLCEAKKEQR